MYNVVTRKGKAEEGVQQKAVSSNLVYIQHTSVRFLMRNF